MQTLHDPIKLSLSELIDSALLKIFPDHSLTITDIYSLWGETPDLKMGHMAFPCFQLAKKLRMGPPQIAQKIKDQLHSHPLVEKSEVQGPYLNFYLSLKELAGQLLPEILGGPFFKRTLTENAPKTMIEYSQPNTHKELHVGHMRNLALGHALVLLYRYANYPVISATYPGDVGTHVAKCLWYLKYHYKGEIPTERKGAFLGEIYTKAYLKLEDEKGSDKEEENRQELTRILSELYQQKGEFFELWKETRQWSISMMEEIYRWANVSFDFWYFESDVDVPSVELAKKYLKEGKLIESEGAIGMDLSDEGLGFCLLIKSDGHGLYATKDLELARRKFQEHGIERNIYVVDTRQSHHFAQVFKVLEKIGFPHAKDCIHLAYDFVELPDGAMSSRKGNIVPLQTLIDNMISHIKETYLSQYIGQWSPSEIDQVANEVAQGAITYGMVSVDPQRKIVFAIEDWLKLDGESGPYLQYCQARIYSLCQKLAHLESNTYNWSLLKTNSEEALLLKLAQFNQIVLVAAEGNRPNYLCNYLYELSKHYNSFYAECPVAKAETPDLSSVRWALSKATGEVLRQGLNILGIPSPKRM